MTDAEYAEKLRKLAGGRTIREVIVDPSAASFIEVLRRNGWKVRKADNDVISGIRKTADALKEGRIVICERCTDCLREMDLYVWDLEAGGDRVVKKNDHAMDDMRYFVTGVLAGAAVFPACVPERKIWKEDEHAEKGENGRMQGGTAARWVPASVRDARRGDGAGRWRAGGVPADPERGADFGRGDRKAGAADGT